MPHLSPSNNRGRSPSSSNGCTTNTGGGNGSERTHHLHLHSVVAPNNTGADLNLIYNVKPRSTTNQDGGRSLPRPARKNYHHQRSSPAGAGTNGTISGWRSRSSEAANGGGGGRSQQFMSRSYAAPTISSRTHQQMQQQQQQRQRGQLSRSHEERALRSITVGRQSLTTSSKNGLNNHSIQQQQSQQHPPPSYSINPVIQSTLSNSITSSSGSRNALAASITQQVMK